MIIWTLTRIGSALISLLLTFIITDNLIHLLPGDPIELLIEETGSALDRAQILESTRMNLDPLQRILHGVGALARMDWGHSLVSGQEITPILFERTALSVQLACLVFSTAILASIALAPLGALLEKQNQKTLSRIISFWGWFSNSVSTVWVGPILLMIFGLWIPLANPSESLFLAWLTLTLLFTGGTLRIVRERVRESVTGGSVRGALALGFSNTSVAYKHGFLPVASAVFAFWGTQFGSLMSGAFVTEVLFGLDGLGSLLIDAVLKRDFPVTQAALFVSSALCIAGNFIGDLAQKISDPRSRG